MRFSWKWCWKNVLWYCFQGWFFLWHKCKNYPVKYQIFQGAASHNSKTLFPFSDLSSRRKPGKIVRAEKYGKTPTCLQTKWYWCWFRKNLCKCCGSDYSVSSKACLFNNVNKFFSLHTILFNLPFWLFMEIFLPSTNHFFDTEIFLLIFGARVTRRFFVFRDIKLKSKKVNMATETMKSNLSLAWF